MSNYDWLSYEQLFSLYRIDEAQLNSLILDEKIVTIVEEKKLGGLTKYSRADVAKHFSLIDRSTLKRAYLSGKLSDELLVAAIGIPAALLLSYLSEGSGGAECPDPKPSLNKLPQVITSESISLPVFVKERLQEAAMTKQPLNPSDLWLFFYLGARNINKLLSLRLDVKRFLEHSEHCETLQVRVGFGANSDRLIQAIGKDYPNLSRDQIVSLVLMLGSDKRFG